MDSPTTTVNLRAQIPIPVLPEARRLLGFADQNLELDGVNLGQFSPTKTKLAVDANQTLTAGYRQVGGYEAHAPELENSGVNMPRAYDVAILDVARIGEKRPYESEISGCDQRVIFHQRWHVVLP